ncbi:hypothetical protein AB0J80_29285 [Actinoplanes sp. NPDC049548]|uniref:hypothetical protein n=1 Tax=Actinoplanes sp. NPDC049548 TaxID=3155152 RepID=UPI003429584F
MTISDHHHAAPERTTAVPTRWSDAALGAAAGLARDVGRAVQRRRSRVAELAERGAVERARYRRATVQAAEAAVTAVATSPVIDRIVDHQLERVLRPVVLAVLDDVLLLLEKEPDRIQALIRGQRESMVDELVGRLRAGAEAGDTAVDRLTFRMLRRAPRSEPAPPADL